MDGKLTSEWCRKNIKNFPKDGSLQSKNGKIYVRRRSHYWDSEAKMGKDGKSVLLGFIVDLVYYPIEEYRSLFNSRGQRRPIPKDEKDRVNLAGLPYGSVEKTVVSGLSDLRLGAIPVFYSAFKRVGAQEDLLKAGFSEVTINTIFSIVSHWLSTGTNSYRQYKDWQQGRWLPYAGKLDAKALSRFATELGQCDEKMNAFYELRLKRYREDGMIDCDGTRITTHAEQVDERVVGKTKNETFEPQIGTVLLYGRKSKQPLLMRNYAGDVPDISTVEDVLNRIRELQEIGIHCRFTLDKGYNSIENQWKFHRDGQDYLMSCQIDAAYVKQALTEALPELIGISSQLDTYLHGVSKQIELEHGGHRFTAWLHMFLNTKSREELLGHFYSELGALKILWNSSKEKVRKHKYFKFFIEKEDGTLEFDHTALEHETEFYGCFADVSSWSMTAKQAYATYKDRQGIECCFKAAKQHLNFNVLRSHSSVAIRGRQFIAFIALAILMELSLQLDQHQNQPEKTDPEDNPLKETGKKKRGRPRKNGAKTKELKTIFLPDVITALAPICLTVSRRTNNTWLSEITVRQKALISMCGADGCYDEVSRLIFRKI